MGNTVQSAYHGSIRIQGTKAPKIDRTHLLHRLSILISLIGFAAYGQRPLLHFSLFLVFKTTEPLFDIEEFNKCIVIEAGKTAVIFTILAVKAIIVGSLLVFLVHGCKYPF
jgi:hypothetical protein